MKKILKTLPEIKLLGVSARTNNAAEFSSAGGKILPTLERYHTLKGKIQNPKNSSLYCVYTDFESDETGDYTYFVGSSVDSFEGQSLETLTIPSQSYAQFTTNEGPMPTVCIEAWKEIWSMPPSDFGGERTYRADFEIYDERSWDPEKAVLDILIGIKTG